MGNAILIGVMVVLAVMADRSPDSAIFIAAAAIIAALPESRKCKGCAGCGP